mmetsp:Transcript_22093/g.33715  ORF Transcript_22093/g.33715 Transcript_22093/m.33715 type:complete len:80 (-) Transcript_22093:686-925(-)
MYVIHTHASIHPSIMKRRENVESHGYEMYRYNVVFHSTQLVHVWSISGASSSSPSSTNSTGNFSTSLSTNAFIGAVAVL